MTSIKWPKDVATVRRKAKANAAAILTGTLLAVDPASGSSSMPGYALFRNGQLVERGTIDIEGGGRKAAQFRLSELYECVRESFEHVDVVAIERLRGSMVAPQLHWSVGVILAALAPPVVVEINISCWKALAKITPGYAKTDDMDAMLIGQTLIELAKGE